MATGYTTTGSLADSLPTIISSARIVREQVGVMTSKNVVDVVTLGKGKGLSWNEPYLGQLVAQAISENSKLDNPQQVSDTAFTLTPTVVGIQTFITDRVRTRISPIVFAKIGQLAQNAIQRKKDTDGTVALDGATTSLCGSGTTMASGYIAAAASRIKGNSTEPGLDPINAVLHCYQLKDIQDEMISGVGTYNIPAGISADVLRNGFQGKLYGVNIYEDNNIAVSSNNAKGGVFAREAILLVQGRAPWAETRREPHIGGGGDSLFLYDEYIFGERSSGNWLFELYSDATAPTS